MENSESDKDEPISSEIEEAASLLAALQKRASLLLSDLRAFQACLQKHGKQYDIEPAAFRKGVESEIKSLQTISKQCLVPFRSIEETTCDAEPQESRHLHALKSSNLPFYEAVWHIARQSRGIVALGKRITWPVQGQQKKQSAKDDLRGDGKTHYGSVTVDIIADDGLKWIKVSTITEKRLIFEMAKEGWECYGDFSDDEQQSGDENTSHDGDEVGSSNLEIVQLANSLRDASLAHRVRFHHPKVHIILPKIREGVNNEIDAVVADIRSTGATVMCADEISIEDTLTKPKEALKSSEDPFTSMLPSSTSALQLTPILNIDCTILLSLISDISHIPRASLPPTPANNSGTYHVAITKQIEMEEKAPLLPDELYPLFKGRQLICTTEAVQRMREIVSTMGTSSERERANIVFAQERHTGKPSEELRSALQLVSFHHVPEDIKLPIETIGFDCNSILPKSPPNKAIKHNKDHRIAQTLLSSELTDHPSTSGPRTTRPILSPINRAVFIYGWLNNTVTITSNRVVAHQLTRRIDEILNREEEEDAKKQNQQKNPGFQYSRDHHGQVEGDKFTDLLSSMNLDESEEDEEFIGPKIYICETARSLVGKEKQALRSVGG